MHDPAVDQEKQIQFEKDKTAFNGLSPGGQRAANVVAAVGFRSREVFKVVGRAVFGVVDVAFNVLFRLPYIVIGRLVKAVANGLVSGLKLGVKAVAAGLLAFGRIKNAPAWREKVTAWEKRTIAKINKVWRDVKESVLKGARRTISFAEYYGALGLYRATRWILNPRTRSGKPLFGNERVNKVVGMAMAACIFGYLTFELTKVFVMAKILHVKIAHSIMTDTAPVYIKLLKQAVFHPLLTASLTAAKFVTLPVIAASRDALKSTQFTKGVAYRYNVRLRTPSGNRISIPFLQKLPVLSFVTEFVGHIVEKASPEFYKARLRHYQELRSPPAQLPQDGSVGKLALAETFNDDARKDSPPPAAAKEQEPPAPQLPQG